MASGVASEEVDDRARRAAKGQYLMDSVFFFVATKNDRVCSRRALTPEGRCPLPLLNSAMQTVRRGAARRRERPPPTQWQPFHPPSQGQANVLTAGNPIRAVPREPTTPRHGEQPWTSVPAPQHNNWAPWIDPRGSSHGGARQARTHTKVAKPGRASFMPSRGTRDRGILNNYYNYLIT